MTSSAHLLLCGVGCLAPWGTFRESPRTGPTFNRLEGIVYSDRGGVIGWRLSTESESDGEIVGRCAIVLPPATHIGGVVAWWSVYGGFIDAQGTDTALQHAAAEAAIEWLRADGSRSPSLEYGLKALESKRGYYLVRHHGNIVIELTCWGALALACGVAGGFAARAAHKRLRGGNF